ncbi:hypothetical protein BCR41DRAFT_307471 [Lobosporangium transversale]|uniref:DUF1688-domain-containing protein n=1 Tax=Lobosporangium transversale TaxID=64571 RepID=A0A1Y2GJK4_9FUNG|nr:hypothetical protein BCR41DRAFT_307471 [Lobosporangium transversale]ORZ12909.1 hypothetical protein BCR41DRAFT_307471 [Lobosporangium transversale]|eukprot:XP_021880258.1 hypothetical protein BCR41DRAFT_307471 [Lobosporangium transversale]
MAPALTTTETIAYLKSLPAVRERAEMVYAKAQEGQLKHFDVDFPKLNDVAKFVVALIKRDHEPSQIAQIPPHTRLRHFDVGQVDRLGQLVESWKERVETVEIVRRLVDLVVVSVLLDAGAGDRWTFEVKPDSFQKTAKSYSRSEGLALASLAMFKEGRFSSDIHRRHQVDADGLCNLTLESLKEGFQVDDEKNPLLGLEGRWELLRRLGIALKAHPEYFGGPLRPGNMTDFLFKEGSDRPSRNDKYVVRTESLFKVVIDGFAEIWPPSRTTLNGVSLGDVWPCDAIQNPQASPDSTDHYVPFHKLSQWMTYSIMEPLENYMHIEWEHSNLLTGLPEYRNGGLLIDLGFMTLKPNEEERGLENYKRNALKPGQPAVEVVPMFEPSDPVIIEWRAMTVATLDRIAVEVRKQLDLPNLTLAQVLQGGTWNAGREIAAVSRPNTKGPPIAILSDGTLF